MVFGQIWSKKLTFKLTTLSERYLDLFYDRTTVTEPRDDDVIDIYDVTDEPFLMKMDSSYFPPVCDAGFFGIKADSDDLKQVRYSSLFRLSSRWKFWTNISISDIYIYQTNVFL